MVERGGHRFAESDSDAQLAHKLRQYAAQLAKWDEKLVEILLLTPETSDNCQIEDPITLVCTFDPEPWNDSHGFFWVVNLLSRSEYEGLQMELDLPQIIDLAVRIGPDVFLPRGKVIRLPEQTPVLWPDHEQGE